DRQIINAVRLGRVWGGANQEEAPISEMRARGPHLLAIDDEMIAMVDGAGSQTRQIPAGVGLGIALAPQLVGAKDARQVPPFLLFGSPVDERRAQQVQRTGGRQGGRAGTKVFLVENDLVHEA